MTETYRPLLKVHAVEPLADRTVHVVFSDGSTRTIDLTTLMHPSHEVFDPVREFDDYFRQVRPDGASIAWPNGANIDAMVLHGDYPPSWEGEDDEAE